MIILFSTSLHTQNDLHLRTRKFTYHGAKNISLDHSLRCVHNYVSKSDLKGSEYYNIRLMLRGVTYVLCVNHNKLSV